MARIQWFYRKQELYFTSAEIPLWDCYHPEASFSQRKRTEDIPVSAKESHKVGVQTGTKPPSIWNTSVTGVCRAISDLVCQ